MKVKEISYFNAIFIRCCSNASIIGQNIADTVWCNICCHGTFIKDSHEYTGRQCNLCHNKIESTDWFYIVNNRLFCINCLHYNNKVIIFK